MSFSHFCPSSSLSHPAGEESELPQSHSKLTGETQDPGRNRLRERTERSPKQATAAYTQMSFSPALCLNVIQAQMLYEQNTLLPQTISTNQFPQ